MSIWSEIRIDYLGDKEQCACIDAWMTDDDCEEGKVIAKVFPKRVVYIDNRARVDEYAQEIINEAMKEFN